LQRKEAEESDKKGQNKYCSAKAGCLVKLGILDTKATGYYDSSCEEGENSKRGGGGVTRETVSLCKN